MRPAPYRLIVIPLMALLCILLACSDDPVTPAGPPAAIADLEVILEEVGALVVSWTVPLGSADQAAIVGYDLRTSTNALAEWADWTLAPTPTAPAAGMRDTVRIEGLAAGMLHHIRIRTRDIDGRHSDLSPRATGTPLTGDPVAPPGVTDLALIATAATELSLSWTVPAAVGDQGDVSGYDLRWTSDPTEPWEEWNGVVTAAPAAPGHADTVRISGLTTDLDHVVRLRTTSGDGLVSPLSTPVYGTPSAAAGRVWRVAQDGSGDTRILQTAMDGAQPGDLILVAPGTYRWTDMVAPDDPFAIDHGMVYIRRNLEDVVIRSEAGPHRTILDAQGQGRMFFVQGYNTGCVIDGFTMINGVANGFDGYAGGAIVGHLSSPTIRNCVFRDNLAIGANDSTGSGGAIWWGGVSEVKIKGCVFEDNEAEVGGAIFLVNTYDTDVVQDCVFVGNTARAVVDNTNLGFGGALAVYNAFATVERCIMAENVAASGGAVWIDGDGPNEGDGDPHTVILDRCTMVGNDAPDGAVRVRDLSDGRILRSIIAHGLDGKAVSWNFRGELAIGCTDLYDYPDSIDPPVGFTDNGGNLQVDPEFCGWERGDGAVGLALDPTSPCATATCGPMGALAPGCQR